MNMLMRHENGFDRDFEHLMRVMMNDFNWHPARFFDRDQDTRVQVNVRENEVEAKLPCAGCKPEDFDVSVVGDFLNITVKRSGCSQENGKKKHYISRERHFEEFSESLQLPVAVRGQEASAKYVDGVLTLSIPRVGKNAPAVHSVTVK